MDTELKAFTSYEEIEKHELKLRLRSGTQRLRFENHWRALGDAKLRNTLFKGAMKDAVSDMKPMQHMAEMMSSGGIASQLVMGMFTRRGGILKRLLGSVAAVVLPNLLSKLPWAKVVGSLASKWGATPEAVSNGHGPYDAQRSV
jgi:hypothetical protein